MTFESILQKIYCQRRWCKCAETETLWRSALDESVKVKLMMKAFIL